MQIEKLGGGENVDYAAYLRSNPPIWGAGKSPEEAIGSCLRTARTFDSLEFSLTPEQEAMTSEDLGRQALWGREFPELKFDFDTKIGSPYSEVKD